MLTVVIASLSVSLQYCCNNDQRHYCYQTSTPTVSQSYLHISPESGQSLPLPGPNPESLSPGSCRSLWRRRERERKMRHRRKVKLQQLHWNFWNIYCYAELGFLFQHTLVHKAHEYQSCALIFFHPFSQHSLPVLWQQHDVSIRAWLNTSTVLAVPGTVDVNIAHDCISAPRKQQASELLLVLQSLKSLCTQLQC